uniref:Uncharacterized protein n=1 Tax=Acrobeloides nanus TaxID=290746 RepID=A0A914E5B3_9BILA
MYALIIGKIVAMRFKFYSEQGKLSKNDKVLAIQFFILCAIQYALSNVENYFEEDETNYDGLALLSLPILIQFFNAAFLLSTNKMVIRGMKKVVVRGSANTKFFVTAIGEPTKSKWHKSVKTTINTVSPIRSNVTVLRS